MHQRQPPDEGWEERRGMHQRQPPDEGLEERRGMHQREPPDEDWEERRGRVGRAERDVSDNGQMKGGKRGEGREERDAPERAAR